MAQNLVKTSFGNMASSYQVNVAIEIPNITEHILTFSLVAIGYLQCLFKYRPTSRCWPDVFYSGGLGANRNVLGKLGMK